MAVSADEAAHSALEKLVSTFVSAWNVHDAHAFAAVFAEDVDFTNVFGIVSHGRAAVERAMRQSSGSYSGIAC